jgi:hypothetical protein
VSITDNAPQQRNQYMFDFFDYCSRLQVQSLTFFRCSITQKKGQKSDLTDLALGILGNVRFYQVLPAESTGCILMYESVISRSDQRVISVKAFFTWVPNRDGAAGTPPSPLARRL